MIRRCLMSWKENIREYFGSVYKELGVFLFLESSVLKSVELASFEDIYQMKIFVGSLCNR